jgi:hypothetical protein
VSRVSIACLLAALGLLGSQALAQQPRPAPPWLDAPPPPPTPAQQAARDQRALADIANWSKNPPPSDPRDFSGVWWAPFQRELRQLDGSHPPMTPKGQEAEDRRVKLLRAGTPEPDASVFCLPNGTPHTLLSPYPIQFVYTPGLITMLFEVGHDVRYIHMDGRPAPKNEPLSFMGYSRGHWEGNTLVVETDHFNDQTTIDQTSLSHGVKMKAVERMTKIKNRLGGTAIRIDVTVEDPEYYTAAWTGRREFDWRGDIHFMEYVCEENNRQPDAEARKAAEK